MQQHKFDVMVPIGRATSRVRAGNGSTMRPATRLGMAGCSELPYTIETWAAELDEQPTIIEIHLEQ